MISNILLWAILFNRRELAEILWLRSKNHLCKIINIDYAIENIIDKTRIEINHISNDSIESSPKEKKARLLSGHMRF